MNIADMSNSMSAHNATCWHNWLIHVGGFTIAFYDVTVDLIALPTGPAIGQLLVWYARPDPRHWRRLTLWGGGMIKYLKVGSRVAPMLRSINDERNTFARLSGGEKKFTFNFRNFEIVMEMWTVVAWYE